MSRNREETVIIHAIASETALRVGYPATVSVYQRDGAHHYAASVGLTDEPNGSKRAAGMEHSHQGGPGYQTVREAMGAGWRYIDGHWLGRAAKEVVEDPSAMVPSCCTASATWATSSSLR